MTLSRITTVLMVQFSNVPHLRTKFVLPAHDAKAKDWPRRCASAAVESVFGRSAEPVGNADHSFCCSGKIYEVCVETMTVAAGSKQSVIVSTSRLKPSTPGSRRVIIAVFGFKSPRGLDCEVKGWAPPEEIRKWEMPSDKQLFKRRGKKFAMMPKERLLGIESLRRMSEDWRCEL